MTTIGALPTEILTSVFVLSINSSGAQYERRTDQFLLGHVCSHWRQALSEMPQLWTEITIKSSNELDKFDLRAARTYLSRCGQALPLTLRVYWGRIIDPSFGEDEGAFKKIVTAHSTRWRGVTIQLFLQVNGVEFLMDIMRGFTSLTTLEFSVPRSFPPPQDIVHGNILGWKASLTFCEQSLIPRITLPSLTHLTLNFEYCFNTSDAAIPILHFLMAPSLSSFTLRLHHSEEDTLIWFLFATFLENSNYPPLRTISSSFYCLWKGTVIRHAPQLEEAHNLYFGLSEWEALALTVPGPSSGLGASNPTFKYAPNLAHLNICQLPYDQVDLLIRIISSRWRGGMGALKTVTLSTEGISKYKCENFIKRARAELIGFEVIVDDT